MCGVAGIVALGAGAPPPEREALLRMARALGHRGPDELGLYRDARAGLAHTRLSIVDLAAGQQPMADAERRHWLVFNGEIFNYIELREELRALGHVFRTCSDTEVILEAWRAWGEAAFERMNGQWALALWDSAAQRLVLSRDRVGICPLHACEYRGRLYFASEVKAIFAAEPSIPRAFDPIGLAQTFTFWSVVPPRSVFQGVSEPPPGSIQVYEGGRVRTSRYWQPRFPCAPKEEFSGSPQEAAEEVRRSLAGATALRMRADVPVGSYLSGGLDSSFVAILGQRAADSGRLQTFSLRFEEAEFDESRFQRIAALHTGSEHHEVLVRRRDIADVFPAVVRHAERPILRTAAAPLFLLSRLVREQGIKVVLTGEGADEVFAGYDLFREAKIRRFWARQPGSTQRPRLLARLYPYLARSPVAQQAMAQHFFGRDLGAAHEPGFGHATRWQSTASLQRLFSAEMQAGIAGHDPVRELLADVPADFLRWSSLAQDQYLELRTLLAGYLLSSQGDRMLMAHSVEGRFPYLDPEVMALAASLPPAYKLRGLKEKHVLKRAAGALVPVEIVERNKQPYRAPDASSFLGDPAPDYFEEALSPAALRAANVFAVEPVERLLKKCRARAADASFSNGDNMALVGVLSTQLLHRELIAQAPGTHAAAAHPVVDVLQKAA
jgi:asparagine synthase (glutamine-hydrolysing)